MYRKFTNCSKTVGWKKNYFKVINNVLSRIHKQQINLVFLIYQVCRFCKVEITHGWYCDSNHFASDI